MFLIKISHQPARLLHRLSFRHGRQLPQVTDGGTSAILHEATLQWPPRLCTLLAENSTARPLLAAAAHRPHGGALEGWVPGSELSGGRNTVQDPS